MIDWRDFNQVAQTLCQNPTEAFLRSAISRSYYAAYNYPIHHQIEKCENWQRRIP